MTTVRWEPVNDLWTLRDAMGKLIEESFVRPSTWTNGHTPTNASFPIDMYETPNELVLKAVLPGVFSEDLDISLTGETLVIKAEAKIFKPDVKDVRWYHQEFRYGTFARSITLPFQVKAEKVEAQFENGILTLTLPKVEAMKPHTIKVKAVAK